MCTVTSKVSVGGRPSGRNDWKDVNPKIEHQKYTQLKEKPIATAAVKLDVIHQLM